MCFLGKTIKRNPYMYIKDYPESSALAALEFWTRQRAYPDNYINESEFIQAFKDEKFARSKQKSKAVSQWESLGPHNRGGRMLALAFNPQNPQTIYAGSASGGLWRSFSSGVGPANWHKIETGFPILGVGAIAICPDDTSTIIIGTGEVYRYENVNGGLDYRTYRGSYGNGILKSSNGGQTWKKVLDWDYHEKHGVQVVRINPLRPESIWAGTSHGLYRSTDRGDTWTLSAEIAMVTDIEINPIDTSRIYIACGNFRSAGHGLYRSVNGGNNWSKMRSGLPDEYGGKALLSMSALDPDIIYAGIGNGTSSYAGTWLCKTIDGGDTWIVSSTFNYSSYQGWFAHDVAVYPNDPDTILCFGVNGFMSDDGGNTLRQVTDVGPGTGIHVDFHALEFQPGSPRTFYIASDGGIYRSQNLGVSYERLDDGLQTSQFYNGFSNSHQSADIALGGLQDNGTYMYKGTSRWSFETGGDGSWTAINPDNDNIIYVSTQYLRIYRSINGGSSYTDIRPPEEGKVCFIAPFMLAPSRPDVVYAGRSYVYKSINGGKDWSVTNRGKELDGNPVLSMAVSYQNPNVVYAATAPRYGHMHIFVSLNGGYSWNNIRGDLPDRYPVDMAVNPLDHSQVYITLSGYGTPHIYRSDDFGQHWKDISTGLPNVPASAVVVDTEYPDHIFVGNDLGVYFSNNKGESWELFTNGLPEAIIAKDLSISSVNRKLRVATHGNGVYQIDLPKGNSSENQAEENIDLRLFPNPCKNFLNIEYKAEGSGKGDLAIISSNGEVVYSRDLYIYKGYNVIVINDLNVGSGLYIVRINQKGKKINKKLMVM